MTTIDLSHDNNDDWHVKSDESADNITEDDEEWEQPQPKTYSRESGYVI